MKSKIHISCGSNTLCGLLSSKVRVTAHVEIVTCQECYGKYIKGEYKRFKYIHNAVNDYAIMMYREALERGITIEEKERFRVMLRLSF